MEMLAFVTNELLDSNHAMTNAPTSSMNTLTNALMGSNRHLTDKVTDFAKTLILESSNAHTQIIRGGGGNDGCLADRLPGSTTITTTTTPASHEKISACDGCNGSHGTGRFHSGTSPILEENDVSVVEPFARAPPGWHYSPFRAAYTSTSMAANEEQ